VNISSSLIKFSILNQEGSGRLCPFESAPIFTNSGLVLLISLS